MDDVTDKPMLREVNEWKLRTRSMALGERTRVMGIVNITPDSFSDGGLYLSPERATEHALRLLDEGADLIDLGAESTKPGSLAGSADGLSAEEEQARLMPVLEGVLKARPGAVVSIDTYKAATARAAALMGAEIINDVSGLMWDSEMAAACAQLGCGVVLMQTRGRPSEWRNQGSLESESILPMVRQALGSSLEIAVSAGIARESIVLDPGYGFGKRLEENFVLLAGQHELLGLGRPILAGLSRKSFLSRSISNSMRTPLLDQTVNEAESRETSSVAALVVAILHGASIVRVHRVREALEAAAIADEVLAARARAAQRN